MGYVPETIRKEPIHKDSVRPNEVMYKQVHDQTVRKEPIQYHKEIEKINGGVLKNVFGRKQ